MEERDRIEDIGSHRYFFIALMGMVLMSTLIILFVFHRVFLKEMFLGWLLAIANGAFALSINRTVIKNHRSMPPFWGLGIHGFRTLILLGILIFLSLLEMENLVPLFVSMLTGYFFFLYAEILNLHQQSTRKSENKALD